MQKKNKFCSIILARGGSKGLKNKNILSFCNLPLIAWTIEACKFSGIDDIYVSSDSNKILKISEKYGAKKILRPTRLSGDNISSEDCWLHAIEELSKKNLFYDITIAPQVTSPLRKKNDIKKALSYFQKNKYDSLFSANNADDLLMWSAEKKSISSINYNYKNRLRRQVMKRNIIENGSFYIFNTRKFLLYKNRIFGKKYFFSLAKWQQFEIDDKEDFKFCEFIMNHYLLNNKKNVR